jgi:general secretion pathway protein J
LIELIVALVLLALAASIMFGSISLATESWDRGEAKANQTRQMRLTTQFLRATLHTAHPVRVLPTGESALPFAGTSDEMSFPGLLPERVGGGLYYFRLALKPGEKTSQLVLQRVVPDYQSPDPPKFIEAEESVLADGIRGLKVQYYGSTFLEGSDLAPPTWKDRWEDKMQWPQLVRLEVTPAQGPAWPPFVADLRLAGQAFCDETRRAHQQCDQL